MTVDSYNGYDEDGVYVGEDGEVWDEAKVIDDVDELDDWSPPEENEVIEQEEAQHYVKNSELLPEIAKLQADGVMSNELGGMILKVARNLSNRPNFINYTWKDDMVSEGVMTCCKYIKNFNLEKSDKPFSYITTICYHAFVNYINKQRKHTMIKDRCFHSQEALLDGDVMSFANKGIDYSIMSKERKRRS